MEGAVILATGNPHMAPLKRTGAGWTAFISIARPGVYDRGTVVFPDGSTYTWSLTDPFDGFFTSRGVLQPHPPVVLRLEPRDVRPRPHRQHLHGGRSGVRRERVLRRLRRPDRLALPDLWGDPLMDPALTALLIACGTGAGVVAAYSDYARKVWVELGNVMGIRRKKRKEPVNAIEDFTSWKKKRREEDRREWAIAWHRIQPVHPFGERSYNPYSDPDARRYYEERFIADKLDELVNRHETLRARKAKAEPAVGPKGGSGVPAHERREDDRADRVVDVLVRGVEPAGGDAVDHRAARGPCGHLAAGRGVRGDLRSSCAPGGRLPPSGSAPIVSDVGVSIWAMPRTPVAATARLDRISVRATESELSQIDVMRGPLSISDFIRDLVQAESLRRTANRLKETE
ncbi:hypothetical protein Q3G72_000277 [Acer saccharum]|nr:hypothetical protein Q3G72_000277 [Acer saccharum]